jgi:hypothetical protein
VYDWAVEGIDAHREVEGVRGDVIGLQLNFFFNLVKKSIKPKMVYQL